MNEFFGGWLIDKIDKRLNESVGQSFGALLV